MAKAQLRVKANYPVTVDLIYNKDDIAPVRLHLAAIAQFDKNHCFKIYRMTLGGFSVGWRVRAIRGATTVPENTVEAIRNAVHELLDELEIHNQLDPNEIVSATFSVTRDLDATFPASIARERPHWRQIPLFDVQQMYVPGSLERCIRFLIHFNTPNPDVVIHHPYLREARNLRPDWGFAASPATAKPLMQSH